MFSFARNDRRFVSRNWRVGILAILLALWTGRGALVWAQAAQDYLQHERNAQAGDLKAIGELGWDYYLGRGIKPDLQKAVQWWNKGAASNDPVCLNGLGVYYYNHPDPNVPDKAFRLFDKAASGGLASALRNLAICYENGHGTAKNWKNAFVFYQIAAEKGDGEACFRTGMCYFDGVGVAQDRKVAVHYFNRGTLSQHVASTYALGRCYQFGLCEERNPKRAFQLVESAAKKGYVPAMHTLGNMLINGSGGDEPDRPRGLAMLRQAMQNGSVGAAVDLAECSEMGIGGPVNVPVALRYYEIAAQTGDVRAKEALQRLESFRENPGNAPTAGASPSHNQQKHQPSIAEINRAIGASPPPPRKVDRDEEIFEKVIAKVAEKVIDKAVDSLVEHAVDSVLGTGSSPAPRRATGDGGNETQYDEKNCPVCFGNRWVPSYPSVNGEIVFKQVPCDECGGTGKVRGP